MVKRSRDREDLREDLKKDMEFEMEKQEEVKVFKSQPFTGVARSVECADILDLANDQALLRLNARWATGKAFDFVERFERVI